ncbi:BTAD domain-containing putative transcriptional regulator [Streptomyces sp. NPDC040724]|uniref:AfsR/SARP family transcriptional regulator n=1 Tax=Streptomyces sp. NPDC040724 TaxID=3155612 RepID=UPI0033D4C964
MTLDGMRFRILGGLEWHLDGVSLQIGRRRERILLGLLLLDIGRTVPAGRLVELLWADGSAPSSARSSMQVHVSRLRSRLLEAGAHQHGFVLSMADGGYALSGDEMAVDVHRFRCSLQEAEQTDDPARRLRHLARAFAEWGGPVLAGTAPEPLVRRLGAAYEELHLSAITQRAEARLALGQWSTMLEELARAAAEHPHHERLTALRMVALYRSDRRGEALRVYDETRTGLVRELGLDPGEELRRLQDLILRADPVLLGDRAVLTAYRPVAAATPPGTAHHDSATTEPEGDGDGDTRTVAAGGPSAEGAEHPHATSRQPRTGVFTGRTHELARLSELVAEARRGSGVVTVVGAAGNGKTALALRWCRDNAPAFPDGHLFIDLRGHSRENPLSAREALSTLLHGLGVAYEHLPHGPSDLADLYQRTIADRRMLVVLDNAESAEQVRPLLPHGLACLTLVTSRNQLGGLIASHGAAMLPLGPLASLEARAVVRSMIGDERVAREPEALAELVLICGRVPLALRIAAANLAVHPACRIADHVSALRSGNPLDSLAVAGDPDWAVRAAFELSYRRLPEAERELFRMLGLLPGPGTTVEAVAALTGRSTAAVTRLLDRLYTEHLAEPESEGRLRLHDLLWRYAQLLVSDEASPRTCSKARLRLLRWYLASSNAAALQLYPQMLRLEPAAGGERGGPGDETPPPLDFADRQSAADWLDAMCAELVKLIGIVAADPEPDPAVWILADTLRGYFWLRRDTGTWVGATTSALGAARRAGDLRGQAAAHQSLALARFVRGRTDECLYHFEQALDLARRAGWIECEAAALSNLAGLFADRGQLADAASCYQQSIAINEAMERKRWQAQPLHGLGEVLYGMGRLADAHRLCSDALSLFRDIGAPDSVARVHNTLAAISADLGDLGAARALGREAVDGYRAIGNLSGEAEALSGLALIASESGDGTGALRLGLAAHRVSRRAGRPRMKLDAMLALGHARYQLGQYERAFEHFRLAGGTSREIGYLKGRIMALLGCAVCSVRTGRHQEALSRATAALDLARESQFMIHEGQAHAVEALAHEALGAGPAARRARRLARSAYARSGYLPSLSPFVCAP